MSTPRSERMRNCGHQCGFTLLEVLVALAILAIGMLAVLSTVGTSTRLSGQLRDRTFAGWVAMNELTSLRLTGSWPATDTLDGDADMAGRKWHWTVTATKTPDPDLLRLDVDVSDPAKPDEVVASVSGFMGRP